MHIFDYDLGYTIIVPLSHNKCHSCSFHTNWGKTINERKRIVNLPNYPT